MDGLQLLNYIGFVISVIVNLCDIRDGRPPSLHWMAASGILGILALDENASVADNGNHYQVAELELE